VAGVLVVGTALAARGQPAPYKHPPDLLMYLLLVASAGALAVRRRHMMVVWGVVFAVTLAYYGRAYPDGPVGLALAVALFTVGATGSRRRSIAVGVLTAAGMISFRGWFAYDPAFRYVALAMVLWVALALVSGHAVASRQALLAALLARAAAAEETREAEAAGRVQAERLRIAREIHDVIAHTIATISVQAGVAEHIFDRQPEQARQALVAIRGASGDALSELRATLSMLHDHDHDHDHDDGGCGPAGKPREPVPGLADLDGLLARTGAAGLPVELTGDLPAAPLPVPVDLTGYRAVQEALTNVLRYAPGASTTVAVHAGNGNLDLIITNRPVASSPTFDQGTGRGLTGMAERVAALGGACTAGPTSDGGWQVHVRLPLPAGAR